MASRWLRTLIGKPRDVNDPHIYHTISLIAVLAWVGLGADGLSSSAYGPDEAFRALGGHTYLAVALTIASALTVLIISIAYSQIIAKFPFGGGGYVVATELLGPRVGVISGSALLVDYVLTVSVSIASGADQVFSVLPKDMAGYKLAVEAVVIGLMVVLNLRGVKESVTILAPIFGLFLVTHVILIVGGVAAHVFEVPRVMNEVSTGFQEGMRTLGLAGMFAVFLRAYSMGAGTYTGIEAVSNGLQIMREPKVQTARRTMLYMAASLALTAGGIMILYLLYQVRPVEGMTMNAVLFDRFAGGWKPAGIPLGHAFAVLSLGAEAALLVVAAQAGFIDGPRVMSSMATDSWLPHRFAQLSDRLTMQNGVLIMGVAALGTLFYTRGDITTLVTMYSINVFVTFSLSQLGMVRYWIRTRGEGRKRGLAIHGVALALCVGILTGVIYEKVELGGWVTIVVTGVLVIVCYIIRRHYNIVTQQLHRLNEIMDALPTRAPKDIPALDPDAPTAVLMVGRYSGLGVHAMLTIERVFPKHFKNFIFISVGVIDAATMKGVEEVERLKGETEQGLKQYVALAHKLGLAADYRMTMGTDVLDDGEELVLDIAGEYPRTVVFLGKLVFQRERWFQNILHNETAYQLQRRLQFAGLNAMVLPVRVLEEDRAAA